VSSPILALLQPERDADAGRVVDDEPLDRLVAPKWRAAPTSGRRPIAARPASSMCRELQPSDASAHVKGKFSVEPSVTAEA
jgi:hypothetical protein